jgi:hypothetical protein
MRTTLFIITLALTVSFALTGCADSSKKLQAAYEAEKSGDIAKAVKIYNAVGRNAAPTLRFPDSKQGKVIAPEAWKDNVEKYLKGISEASAKPDNSIAAALAGLERCMELRENDNSAQIHPPKSLDEKAFSGQFNKVFPSPPAGSTEWSSLATFANQKNFSILQISSPVSFTYKISVVSRQASRRIDFTLYPESRLVIPLPPGDYSVIVKSSVTFQKGKYWTSDFSTFSVNIPAQPSLVAMNLRTRVARKQ